jgi:hypothetical protein
MSASEVLRVDFDPSRSAAAYLGLLLVAPVAYHFGLTVAPTTAAGPILLLGCVAAAVGPWLLARSSGSWSVMMRTWLGLAIIQWLYLVLRDGVGGIRSDVAAILVPVALLLIWGKRPSRRSAWAASDTFAASLVVMSAVALGLEVGGLIPSWYEGGGQYFLDLAAFDRDTHWLTLNGALGMDGRWGGVLRDPNAIGPVGALLTVYGFTRSGVRRVVFAGAGTAIVVLSDSRATYGALALGLLALLLLPGWGVRLMTVTPAKVAAAGLGLLAGARLAYDLVTNPAGTLTLTGRTAMWPDFVSLWPDSPVFGVGTRAVNAAQQAGILPVWSSHGHNQYIDTLVRYGVVGIVLSGALIVLALIVAGLAARRGRGLSIALMVVLIVAMTSNLVLDWRYPSVALSWFLVLLVLASTHRECVRTEAA